MKLMGGVCTPHGAGSQSNHTHTIHKVDMSKHMPTADASSMAKRRLDGRTAEGTRVAALRVSTSYIQNMEYAKDAAGESETGHGADLVQHHRQHKQN